MLPARSPGPAPPAAQQSPGLAPLHSVRGRPSWSGLLRISLVAVPVRAYSAVRSAAASHFHLLHANCGQRLHYHKHCPQHRQVTADVVVRDYAYAPRQHLVIEPEELDQLRPARDKALTLEQFVPVGEIDPVFYAGCTTRLRCGRHRPGKERSAPAPPRMPSEIWRGGCWLWPLARWTGGAIAIPRPKSWPAWSRTKLAQQAPKPASEEPALVLRLIDALKQSVDEARNAKAANGATARKARGRRATG
jgi:hypothetical protein